MLAAMGKLQICKTASCSDSQLQAQLVPRPSSSRKTLRHNYSCQGFLVLPNKPGGQRFGDLQASAGAPIPIAEYVKAVLQGCGTVGFPSQTQHKMARVHDVAAMLE